MFVCLLVSLGWRVATSLTVPPFNAIELAATGVTIPQSIHEQFYVILRRILRGRQEPSTWLMSEQRILKTTRQFRTTHRITMSKARNRVENTAAHP